MPRDLDFKLLVESSELSGGELALEGWQTEGECSTQCEDVP